MSFKKGVAPVFDRKWWDKNRPMALGGCGVGKALEGWVKNCKKGAADLKTRDEFKEAFATCELLKTALAKAKKKCGKDKDSADCVDKYETIRAKYEKDADINYQKQVAKYKSDREEFREFCRAGETKMKNHLVEIRKLEKYLQGCEDELTTDVNENGGAMAKMYYDQAGPASNGAKDRLKKATADYETDGEYIKERRGGSWSASSYGLSEEDGAKLTGIFNEGTKLSASATNIYNTVCAAAANCEEIHLQVVTLFMQGKKSLKDVVETTKKALADAKKLVQNVEEEARKGGTSFGILDGWVKAKPTQPEWESVPVHLQKLQTHTDRIEQVLAECETFCNKIVKRAPPAMKDDKQLKPHLDAIRMAHMSALGTKDKWDKAHTKAKEDAKKVTNAGPADPVAPKKK